PCSESCLAILSYLSKHPEYESNCVRCQGEKRGNIRDLYSVIAQEGKELLLRCLPFIALLAPLYSQQFASWRDPSTHTVQFITVDKNVRLEVLDWGGSGRPVVLLAGAGTQRTYSTSSHRSSRPTTMFMA